VLERLKRLTGKGPLAVGANAASSVAAKRSADLPIEFSRLTASPLQCPICRAPGVEYVSAYPGRNRRFRMAVVLYCTKCGSGYVPDADRILEGYYRDEYAETNRRDRDLAPEAYFAAGDKPPLNRYFNRARAHVNMLTNAGATFGTVLDYGSGPGYFLSESKPTEPFAVELDSYSWKYLDHLGATRIVAEELGRDRFDVIVASHVIEHFTDTTFDTAVSGIVAALKPGGRLLVEVPHGGHSYLGYTGKQEPHTLFFTPAGLLATLRRAGLKVLGARARGTYDKPIRPDAIYAPTERGPFNSLVREFLVVVGTRDV
jgi:SAM-dependent methyltransferase